LVLSAIILLVIFEIFNFNVYIRTKDVCQSDIIYKYCIKYGT
jgi:hypothetical protein